MECEWTQHLRQGLGAYLRSSASATGERCKADFPTCGHEMSSKNFLFCSCGVIVARFDSHRQLTRRAEASVLPLKGGFEQDRQSRAAKSEESPNSKERDAG